MYHASKNAHADALESLAAFLALPAGVVEKILIYSHDLYCPRSLLKIIKSRQETVKSKKLLSRQPVQSLGIGDSLTLTMPCMASFLMIPKKRPPLEGKPPNSTIIRSREHCIVDRMTGSCSAVYNRRRRRMYSKKRMTAYV